MNRALGEIMSLTSAFAITASAFPIAAHHGLTMFDLNTIVMVSGEITDVRWTNPHVVIVIETTVGKASPGTQWNIELPSPGSLVRAGWSRHIVKADDQVSVEVHPRRSGANSGHLKTIRLDATGRSSATGYLPSVPSKPFELSVR